MPFPFDDEDFLEEPWWEEDDDDWCFEDDMVGLEVFVVCNSGLCLLVFRVSGVC